VEHPSIYDAVGGEPAFLALAAEHHRRCLADPLLEHPFSHGVRADHVERLAAYWAEVLGGPRRYSERYGGEAAMMGMHAGYGINRETGRRCAARRLRPAVAATGGARRRARRRGGSR
jgi:hemoglobin